MLQIMPNDFTASRRSLESVQSRSRFFALFNYTTTDTGVGGAISIISISAILLPQKTNENI